MNYRDEMKARQAGADAQEIIMAALDEVLNKHGGGALVSATITLAGSVATSSVMAFAPDALKTQDEKRLKAAELSKRFAKLYAEMMLEYGIIVNVADLSQPPNRN